MQKKQNKGAKIILMVKNSSIQMHPNSRGVGIGSNL